MHGFPYRDTSLKIRTHTPIRPGPLRDLLRGYEPNFLSCFRFLRLAIGGPIRNPGERGARGTVGPGRGKS